MNRSPMLFLALGLAAGCTPAPAPNPSAPEASPPPVADVVDRALASVVLVVNTRDDGSVVYGAGIVLDGHGLVVTSAHLLAGSRSLRAMLYEPHRVSYTPLDGGLARYLFEYEKDLVGARVERADALTDLALVRLDADTSRLPLLPRASRPLRRGERVFAIGHPQENVWSFTAGQVGALHHGAVQHDALLGFGSSGGPLLNERGELVGVNTSKVVSEPRGLSFARPVALVEALVRPSSDPGGLDLSTPERAAKTCWLARELGLPSAESCVDRGPASRAPVPAPAREHTLNDTLSIEPTAFVGPAPTKVVAGPDAPSLCAGARVEEVRVFGDRLAWVRLEARTREGNRWGFSELYARAEGQWRQRTPPAPDELSTLPPGWPAPINGRAARGRLLRPGEFIPARLQAC
jgi:trypsin-like peptidase